MQFDSQNGECGKHYPCVTLGARGQYTGTTDCHKVPYLSRLALGAWVCSVCTAGIMWRPHGLCTVDLVSTVSRGILWKEPVGRESTLKVMELMTVWKVTKVWDLKDILARLY